MSTNPMTQEQKTSHGAEDSGKYFRYMVDFVGFTPEDARAIKESGLVIEKHLPQIVSEFYTHLLRYPPTRKHFLKPDGSIDHDYLQKRMYHLTNFWRRTASGEYDDEYARYIDYVGKAHTSHGADPSIYIAERYVIGQVGFIQHAVSEALHSELHAYDPDLEKRATRGWNLLLMVILEMLARAYNDAHEGDSGPLMKINHESMTQLAVETYERGLGLIRPPKMQEIRVARLDEIPAGQRKIVQVDDLSIGVFHHKGEWYAVHNHCLHRGGPVATGLLEGDVLTCPWHGYQYDVTSGQLLVDPSSKLDMYRITIREDEIYLQLPLAEPKTEFPPLIDGLEPDVQPVLNPVLSENEFNLAELPPGKTKLVKVNGQDAAVYNVDGRFYATANACTHVGGPLNEGELKGKIIECPWHGSCFDVTSGAVICGPAEEPLATYTVTADGEVGRVQTPA
jgi:nitrite reductase/ring-hydroxylating ferredoxin subunit